MIEEEIKGVGVTGSGREFVSMLIGGDVVESEVISHYLATIKLFPDVKTIFDIGGEDCKLMTIHNKQVAFHMNFDCGGGTGAMIESIATRMGVPIEEIGDLALKSKTKVSIASKCGIFAQSAVVSKLNKGVPKEDILMGVCRGLIGNFISMLAKGIELKPPFVFQGATAKNKALVKCFEEELESKVLVSDIPEYMGALGVALRCKKILKDKTKFKGFDISDSNFETKTHNCDGCPNQCEVTSIYENNTFIGCIGNRCEKGIKNNSKED